MVLAPPDPAPTSTRRTPAASSIPLPYPHFMGFAPLDVWFRLLLYPRVAVPARFWPRLLFALFVSFFITIVTLPERLLAAIYLRLSNRHRPLPGPLIILGYYRSGTTLLQYLLSCDPDLYSPHWGQAFAPQGWCLSWFLLRWFVLPFSPRSRPQDNVAFGPLVPAEDDFALNNGALASTLPGRIIVPQAHRFYDRFNDLKDLTPAERQRWGDYQLGFVRKLAPLAGGRRVLLKTPAHTARIPALLDLFRITTGVKFVYISRHPHKVFRSNVAMLRQLTDLCGLQPPLSEEELEDYGRREYVATEEEYARTRSLIPSGNLAEVRLQDLQADPLGTMRRVYDQLGLTFTSVLQQRMLAYLHAHRDYQPNVHAPPSAQQKERMAALQPLVEQGRHDDPAPQPVELPTPDPSARHRQIRRGMTLGFLAAAMAFAALWLLVSWMGIHSLGFAWPCAVAIGLGVLHGAARHGSAALGIFALALTALVLAAVLILSPDLLPSVRERLALALPFGPLWWGLALASAYRIASQRF
jgi:hypothetical protein